MLFRSHVSVPAKDLLIALKTSNVLIDLNFDGRTELTLPKAVTRHPISGALSHVDLLLVRRGEKVKVEVPVHIEGNYDKDGILEHVNHTIEVEAEATSIPQFLVLNVEGLMAGQSKHASEVTLPAGVTLASDGDLTVVHLGVKATATADEVAAPAADAKKAAEAPKKDAGKK